MCRLISTNIFTDIAMWEALPAYLEADTGVEIFPLWHLDGFEALLERMTPLLKDRPIQFHSPYYGVEPSLVETDAGYEDMMDAQKKTIRWAKKLNAGGIVFHHNNRMITDKAALLEQSHRNYTRIRKWSEEQGIPQVVENAGLDVYGNALFEQDEFIAYCQKHEAPCLIDLGHAHANGWDWERVIHALRDRIHGYHVHNNDGRSDGHRRILDGTLDMERFAVLYKQYTPSADLVLEYTANLNVTPEQMQEDLVWLRRHCDD